MHQPIKALIFDLEGVVIDSMHTVWIPADTEFCRRRGFDCPTDLLTQLTGTTLLEGVKIFKKYHGFGGDEQLMLQERIDIADKLFQKDIPFIKGFQDFINLHQDLPAAIATSLRSENLASVDRQLHLKKIFKNHVYSIYAVGVRSKPNPDIFLYAAKQLGIDPSDCLVFEDAPNGIEAARRAGMRCVALATTFPREHLGQATIIVDSYNEINLSKLKNGKKYEIKSQ
ncbi:MAG: HAD family phosphatase [Patescibacteria group bacterium]|jgi:HAD superfamily hydrolase (TIGR01509 family)